MSAESFEPRTQRTDTRPPNLRSRVVLAPYTTFGIGGPARYLLEPEDRAGFTGALRWALVRQVPFFVMGGGANVLVHDRGFDGLVIVTRRLDHVSVNGTVVEALCGVPVDALVGRCADEGLTGLEFAAGLPGSLGGAVFMNARAYGGEFSGVVREVESLQVSGGEVRVRSLRGADLGYSYKKSVFQEGYSYVYRVRLELACGDRGAVTRAAAANRARRREAGQFSLPNAGCVFKNDYGVGRSTGEIIDSLGLKGTRVGGARVFEKHGNFIVNSGGATALDVYRLMLLVERTVQRELGVKLEREIVLLGF